MRSALYGLVIAMAILAPAVALGGSAPSGRAAVSSAPQLVAFRGFHLHLGGGGAFGRHRTGYGSFRRRGSHGLLRRVVHALAFAYLLHLLFSHGGLSLLLWILVIGLVVHLVRRRRQRRYSY